MTPEVYTRGGPNMPDARGQSMVAKHADKLQQEKEERAMTKLAALMPRLSKATHAVALQECGWDDELALTMLRQFESAKAQDLEVLRQKREEIHHKNQVLAKRKKDNKDNERSRRHKSVSESSEDDRRRRQRSKRSSDRSGKERRGKRRHHEERRDQKRDRDRGDESRKNRSSSRFGKYGVLRESDYDTKRPEFTLWALQVKGKDIESMSRFEERELFHTFMEDYNTATLPHKKYYDLAAYEKRHASETGLHGDVSMERVMFNDEAERKRELAEERQRQHAERLREAYEEMQSSGKAADMRAQELLRARMSLAYRTGNQEEAQRLAERLKPDDPRARAS